ncbi:MAG: hypothetical protein NC898_05520 [Candidatus Omnitrophica bacterium]|nr:hypothetical protein [Candidatus Omnitrophota bacterium]MCM8793901.1 hypothetical protein [Candidatus Omnitrophota bacterium]
MHVINRKRGAVFLAVIGFIILTAIIAEAFLIYFYNQYRLTLQKLLYEKAFYIALSGIEWAKVLIKTNDSRLANVGDTVVINNWGAAIPEINLLYAHQPNEYPDLPYRFNLVIKRSALNKLVSYSELEISMTEGIKIFSARRIEVTLATEHNPNPPPDFFVLTEEIDWQEITPAALP